MGQVVQRAFRYRCYPTDTQAEQLNRTFGWCGWSTTRLVYNKAREAHTSVWNTDRQRLNAARNILAAGLVER